MRKTGTFFIQSKLLIAYSALILTFILPAQVGCRLVLNPYLVIVFCATFLVYNLTRLVVLKFYKMPLEHPNDQWANQHQNLFYGVLIIALMGLGFAIFLIRITDIFYLIPLFLIVLFYALPFLKIKHLNLNLRRLPFLKIFLIIVVWTFATALLPLLQLNQKFQWWVVFLVLVERLSLITALALLFDIRDMQADASQGLQTIPLKIGESKTLKLSNACGFIFFLSSVLLYLQFKLWYLILCACVSLLILLIIINYKPIKSHKKYYDLYLDGLLLIHGLLILVISLIGR